MKKAKVTLSINKDVWQEFTAILKERGYPKGVASWVAQEAFRKTTLELLHASSTQLDLFFDRKK